MTGKFSYMEQLKKLVADLEEKIIFIDQSEPSVSAASVGWHIQHTLLVITQIIKVLKSSDPSRYKKKFNLPRTVVYFMGRIPRGRGKAPQTVVPGSISNALELSGQFNDVRNAIAELPSIAANKYMTHPYFGDLNTKQTATFLLIHTEHHLKIVNDIIAKGNTA